jgi:uncharacterized protein (UPF0335 family)
MTAREFVQETRMSKRREQISIPIDQGLREFIERIAREEDRTVAGQVRHFIAEAARNSATREREAA